jgi:hypothetical protein
MINQLHHYQHQKKRYRGASFFPALVQRLNQRLTITTNASANVSFGPATHVRGRVASGAPQFAVGHWDIMIP